MNKTTARNIETMTSQKWRNERNAHKDTKALLRNAELQHKQDLDIVMALTQENLELGKINKDLLSRYDMERLNYTLDQNHNVTSIYALPSYREDTHAQELDERVKYIKSALYQSNAQLRFVYEENGKMKIDETKFKKFIIAGGL
jgi:hypothetical protein